MNDTRKQDGVDNGVGSTGGSASGGPEVWNVVAWGDVRECRSISSALEEVREALEDGCRTISIERQGAPNIAGQTRPERSEGRCL